MQTYTLKNGRVIGQGQPCFIIAEIGLNHNGSLDIALQLIDEAVKAGCDAVKFQKRTPEVCTPKDQWDIMRETPWGTMRYIDYRYKVEFGKDEYKTIDAYCQKKGIIWFASCWDEESVEFLEQFEPALYKAASAALTDMPLLKKKKDTGKPLIISTGMSTMDEITTAVDHIGTENLLIAHSTSSYPAPISELNLRMINTLQSKYPDVPVGYSGHETGLATTLAAVAMGATFVERHFTLDRAMWGSDQAASVEPVGMAKLVKDIRDIEAAMGDGVKKVYDSELGPRAKLRRVK
ncbi:MAG: N-acetylneuraminate synthase family protein [Bacteroidetes bacterium]|nr:N-acetylneuraminate synthase family protein [Bacteroidota bacterium]MBS1686198.1 N-acetylneuraminate synthase family protein [Bacteroidota bacterium]